MPSMDELKAQLENEKARHATAMFSDEEAEQSKMLAQIAEAKAERLAAEKPRRALRGAEIEAEARKVAAGRYLVKFFDLAALLPDVEQEKLPGEGCLVVRSPPTSPVDVLAQFYRELEAKERSLVDIYADLVCASVVSPDVTSHEAGMAFRNFIESSIGRGTSIPIGDAVTAVGGLRSKQAKRGRE